MTSKKRDRLSLQELKEARSALIDRKRRLAETMNRLSGDAMQNNPKEVGELTSLPQHLADLGTGTFEQDRDLGLAERASQEIAAIDLALERLEAGSYGICEACGLPIARERLQALPYATLCASCKAQQEAA
jgi:RNA polymerase-binding protein DksA